MKISYILRFLIGTGIFFACWQIAILITSIESYLLPSPFSVLEAWWFNKIYLAKHASITAIEIILGLTFGTFLGLFSAILMSSIKSVRKFLMPILVVTQAIPVFAIAPLLVLWFGYGMTSKIVMATIIIYFPVASSFVDGIRRTEIGWLEMAKVMTGGDRQWSVLWHIRIPAALPSLSTGIRVATAAAPIGAIVGEWVGSSAGLGYAMLHANARMQIDIMFSALFTLGVMSIILYFSVDWLLKKLISWQSETDSGFNKIK